MTGSAGGFVAVQLEPLADGEFFALGIGLDFTRVRRRGRRRIIEQVLDDPGRAPDRQGAGAIGQQRHQTGHSKHAAPVVVSV